MRLYKYFSSIILMILVISMCLKSDAFDTTNGGSNYYFDSAISQNELKKTINIVDYEKPVVIGNTQSQELIKVAYQEIDTVGGDKYWKHFGFNNWTNWCCVFVSWCADQCGYIDSGIMPFFTSVGQGFYEFKNRGEWMNRYGSPAPGMIVFFDFIDYELNFERDGYADHVGIVATVNEDYIVCIEGNYKNTCALTQYSIDCPNIYGYGTPNFQ